MISEINNGTPGGASCHIGLVGCGQWGRYILRDLKTLGARVSVVAASQESRSYAVQFGADCIVDSIAKLPSADGYVVASSTSSHAEVVTALLPSARPIYVEKPFTNDAAAARKIVDAAGERVFVMEKWRYHAGIEALRDVVKSGEFGPVESLRTCRWGWRHSRDDVDNLWHLMPHDLSIAYEILGYIPDPVFAWPERSRGYLSGMLAVLGHGPTVVAEVSGKRIPGLRLISLCCRDAVAVMEDAYATHLRIRRVGPNGELDHGTEELRQFSGEMPLLRQLRAFLHHVNGGPPPKSSAAEGLRNVEVLAKLRELADGIDNYAVYDRHSDL